MLSWRVVGVWCQRGGFGVFRFRLVKQYNRYIYTLILNLDLNYRLSFQGLGSGGYRGSQEEFGNVFGCFVLYV